MATMRAQTAPVGKTAERTTTTLLQPTPSGKTADRTATQAELTSAEVWTSVEITLEALSAYASPYVDQEITGTLSDEMGRSVTRPGYWDGGSTWKLRFALPPGGRNWHLDTQSRLPDKGLNVANRALQASESRPNGPWRAHGLLRPSPQGRSVVRGDGSPYLLIGDTPWSIPFRATPEQVHAYAHDRASKGFNAALLMSVQPDMRAVGPNMRDTPLGFVRGFADLDQGQLDSLEPSYFRTLDTLASILLDAAIVPVWQPVFHGFGWKGLDVAGCVLQPADYVRYCRYLLARYGAQPALWLIAGDNGGRDPGVREAGQMLDRDDAYEQPVGLHYSPCGTYVAEWSVGNPLKHCMHGDSSWQQEPWLDFQWTQTGHDGRHDLDKVMRMAKYPGVKAVANGEPTYEGMGGGKFGLDRWQADEAWLQLTHGGTMGVVYGAAALWQWKVGPDEAGWDAWSDQPLDWRGAMALPGSAHVGRVGQILANCDFTDAQVDWTMARDSVPVLRAANGSGCAFVRKPNLRTHVPLVLPKGAKLTWQDPYSTRSVEVVWRAGQTSWATPDSTQAWVFLVEGVRAKEVD